MDEKNFFHDISKMGSVVIPWGSVVMSIFGGLGVSSHPLGSVVISVLGVSSEPMGSVVISVLGVSSDPLGSVVISV